ncbi:hypothetical protein ACF0H5_014979 [Mactra antiquata]
MRTLTLVMLFISVVDFTTSNHPYIEKKNSSACSICKCYKTVVDCSNKNLTNTTMPNDFPDNTTKLILTENRLGNLGPGIFKNLTKLETLVLFRCAITSLSNGTFNGLTSLKEMNISYNQPLSLTSQSTPSDLFLPLTSLEKLKMYGNIGTYDSKYNYIDRQLTPLKMLKELWIDGFTQNPFGETYENLTSLTSMVISGELIHKSWRRAEFCEITEIGEDFLQQLYNIQNLTIRNCGIKAIHKEAFSRLLNLRYLDLSNNVYLTLAIAFESLQCLNTPGMSKLAILVLNNVGTRTSKTCNFEITGDMAGFVSNIPLEEIYLNYNHLSDFHFQAFVKLPKTIKKLSGVGNEFQLGLYMFYTFYLSNITTIDISYQGVNEFSMWVGRGHSRGMHIGTNNSSYHSGVDFYGDPTDANDDDDIDVVDGRVDEVDDNILRDGYNYNNELINDTHGDIYTPQEFLEDSNGKRLTGGSKTTYTKVCPLPIHNKYIPPGTITGFMPPKLTYLDISHSKIGYPYVELYLNGTNSLKLLNMSNSFIYCWDGPVHGLNKLEILDLSHNLCDRVSQRAFQKFNQLKHLDIGYNFLAYSVSRDIDGRILENLINLEFISIRNNRIYKIPKKFFKGLVSLKTLDLAGNRIFAFEVEMKHMTKLRYVNLKDNQITTLSPNVRKELDSIAIPRSSRNGIVLNLNWNSINCFCNNLNFLRWVYQNFAIKNGTNSLQVDVSICKIRNEEVSKITSKTEFGQVVNDLQQYCRSYTSLYIGVSVGLGVMINVVIAYIVYKYRWRLQYWYFVTLSNRRCMFGRSHRDGYEEVANTYTYDVYVASCEDQRDFVLDSLRKELKERQIHAFLQASGIRYGWPIASEIGNGINQSRVVIFLLSKDWSADFEMKIARAMWFLDIRERKSPFSIGIDLGTMDDSDWGNVQDVRLNVLYDYPGEMSENDKIAFWTKLSTTIKSGGLSN